MRCLQNMPRSVGPSHPSTTKHGKAEQSLSRSESVVPNLLPVRNGPWLRLRLRKSDQRGDRFQSR